MCGMYTFRKNERLSNYGLKSLLFDKGDSFFHYPFRVIFLFAKRQEAGTLLPPKQHVSMSETFQFPAKCLIAVSGKRVKKANKRNRIKRLTKEAYRKNKNPFYSLLEEKDMMCLLGLIYIAKHPISYEEVEKSVASIMVTLQEKVSEQSGSVHLPRLKD
ncbi:MAG: ribonuclease P protein component [Bacteroidales bacterium]